MYLIFAFITGALIVISMIINSKLAQHIGVVQGAFVNNTVASIVIFLVLIFNGDILFNSKDILNCPLWAYLGGFLSIFVVSFSNIIIPKIPAIYSTLLLLIGQLFTGIIIDFYIESTASLGKIVGGLLIIAGLVYNIHIDKSKLMTKKEFN